MRKGIDMTQAELDRLVAEANLRLRDFIARCAGQQWRRWREKWGHHA